MKVYILTETRKIFDVERVTAYKFNEAVYLSKEKAYSEKALLEIDSKEWAEKGMIEFLYDVEEHEIVE